MFKFNIPMTIILSSGSLILLAVGSILFAGNTAYTSDVHISPEAQAFHDPAATVDSLNLATDQMIAETRNISSDTRRRNGRLYSQSGYGGQQQASMDSYAAAYAAANSPSSSDGSQDMVQSSVQSSDSGSYSSFGEPSQSVSSSSGSSSARQLPSSDYSPHSSYYSSYMSPSSSSYGSQLASGSNHHSHHYPYYHKSRPLGYPTNGYDRQAASSYYDRSYLGTSGMPLWASSPSLSSGGLMSSASTALSSWTSGFSVAEIICGLIALSIGAVILGAPFFLIYLALMGNFSGSGTLSLTNPTGTNTPAGGATATVNGRRKRLAIFEQLSSSMNQKRSSELGAFADAIVNQLSPFVDFQQVTGTFKRLVDSIDKYSNMKPEVPTKKSS